MYCIVWERPDGAVTVEYPDDTDEARTRALEQTAIRLALKYGPGSIPHVYDSVNLPEPDDDQRFFNAWEWKNGCNVNMPRARLIHMDRIRQVRNKALEDLDVPWMKAIEIGDQLAADEVGMQRQTLRDIPQTFKLSGFRTPATLKTAWPANLPRPGTQS